MFTDYGNLGITADYEGSNNITDIEFIFKTNLVTQLPMELVIEKTDYNFNIWIDPYGNGWKKIKEIHILDKSNKPLYYCIFKDTKDIFWKQFVTEIKLNFSFDKSNLKQSNIEVELKLMDGNCLLVAQKEIIIHIMMFLLFMIALNTFHKLILLKI